MRLFLAFAVDETAAKAIARAGELLKSAGVRGKWTAPRAWHITVLFIGEVAESILDRIKSVAETVCTRTATIRLKGLGLRTFGRPPRVLSAELGERTEVGRFAELAEALSIAYVREGIIAPPEGASRRAIPHVTMTRFRYRKEAATLRSTEALQARRNAEREIQCVEADCTSLGLYRSELTPEGANYRLIQSSALS